MKSIDLFAVLEFRLIFKRVFLSLYLPGKYTQEIQINCSFLVLQIISFLRDSIEILVILTCQLCSLEHGL